MACSMVYWEVCNDVCEGVGLRTCDMKDGALVMT